jgi:hypothetical protein
LGRRLTSRGSTQPGRWGLTTNPSGPRRGIDTALEASLERVRQLMQLKGIGINGVWVVVMEFFSWRKERFGAGGKRLRRIGIVAVARQLLIALWHFLETRALPEGAVLKEA